jgi:hypothetical protein
MAASVAAELANDNQVEVETVRGGLGEFSVHLDGQKIIDTNRFWYPTPAKVVAKTRARLAERRRVEP